MNSQRKTGVLLSYGNFSISIAGNLLLTPALIRLMGDSAYSLYQVMRSFGGALLMFNLGVSTIVARSMACGDEREKQNTLAIGLLLSVMLAALAAGASGLILLLLPKAYDAAQLSMARSLFGLFASASICHILTDAFAGCLIGREHFAANALTVTFKYLLRFGLMAILIQAGADAAVIAGVDLIVGFFALLCLSGYTLFVLREKPKWFGISRAEFQRMLSFSAAVLLQEGASQLNTHMDPILLEWFAVPDAAITMYSSALMIYTLYHQLVSMIGGYYLAPASRMVAHSADGQALTDMLIHPGRFQAAIAVGAIAGFALFGRRFITLWIGERYLDAYGVVLALMFSALIPLVESAALSILDAQFKRMYRSAVLVSCALLNAAVSMLLMPFLGFWGAAAGTSVSLLTGQGWLMNRFYQKQIGLDIPRFLHQVLKPVVLPLLLACLGSLPLLLLPPAWPTFLCQCAAFLAIYTLALLEQNRYNQSKPRKG